MVSANEFALFSTVELSHCPCTVLIVDEIRQIHIIGCYELVSDSDLVTDDDGVHKNGRYGSLVLIEEGVKIHEISCADGGVFDLRIVPDPSDQVVCAAHSNGTLAFYKIIDKKLVIDQRVVTGSEMLCSVSIANSGSVILAGDSKSKLYSVRRNIPVLSGPSACPVPMSVFPCSISSPENPIWCIHNITISTEKILVMVGSEDGLTRFFLLNGSICSECLSTLKEASAGVTSIATISRKNDGHHVQYDLLTGSYDERIRIYQLNIETSDEVEPRITIKFKSDIRLKGSGIWRLVPIAKPDEKLFLVAAMFGGAYILTESWSTNPLPIPDVGGPSKDDQRKSEHLIYGIAGDKELKKIIITSFYEKKFMVFARKTED